MMGRLLAGIFTLGLVSACTPLTDVTEMQGKTLAATSGKPLRYEPVALRAIYFHEGARTELPGARCTISGKNVVTLRDLQVPANLNVPVFPGLPQTFKVTCSASLGATQMQTTGIIRPLDAEKPSAAESGRTYAKMGGALFTSES
tara:strand:- start:108 stop:542 length:435 start_codon:yes stop_codon:yes gene_type:complete